LLFNVNLNQNDGLFAYWVSQGEMISYADALLSIGSLVKSWHKELNSGMTIVIDKVGKLSKDKEGILQFEQNDEFNFLPESYGLTSFISPAIKRQGVRRKLEKKILQYTESSPHNRHFIPKALKWAAFLVLPIGIAAVLSISNFNKITSLSVGYSGLLFSNSSSDLIKSTLSLKPAIQTYKHKQAVLKVSPPAIEPEKKEPTAIKSEQQKPYAIIVGAFKFIENANGLVSDLKAKGYDAAMVGQTKTGLYRVSVHSFTDKNEAFRQLALVRSNEFSSAWLLVK
jgi:hypothetical protein